MMRSMPMVSKWIENLDTAIEIVDEQLAGTSFQLAATPAVPQKVYTGADFEDGNRYVVQIDSAGPLSSQSTTTASGA